MKPKRNYRDSLFRSLFNRKPALAELYEALTGVAVAASAIRITTLRGVFFNDLKNDISFQAGSRTIVLLEHQSTLNENMPLRLFFYAARLYQRLADAKLCYRTARVPIPAPEFFVFYNGVQDEPDERVLRLSDAFLGESRALELLVRAYNINYGKNRALLEKSRTLYGYSFFIHRVRQSLGEGRALDAALRESIRFCIEHDVLKEYLEENEKEVFDMVSFQWDMDAALETREEEGMERGFAQGMERGMERGMEIAALNFLRSGTDPKLIQQCTNLPMTRIEELARSL